MAGKVVKQSFCLLNKFALSEELLAPKTSTSHMRKPWVSIPHFEGLK